MKKVFYYLLFIILIGISAILYTFANFKEAADRDKSLALIVAIGVGFAIAEYMFKIPAMYLVREHASPIFLQLFWVVITFIAVILFQLFYLQMSIPTHTYIIVLLVATLVGLEFYLTNTECTVPAVIL